MDTYATDGSLEFVFVFNLHPQSVIASLGGYGIWYTGWTAWGLFPSIRSTESYTQYCLPLGTIPADGTFLTGQCTCPPAGMVCPLSDTRTHTGTSHKCDGDMGLLSLICCCCCCCCCLCSLKHERIDCCAPPQTGNSVIKVGGLIAQVAQCLPETRVGSWFFQNQPTVNAYRGVYIPYVCGW